jgi:hypothetical protein
VVGVQGLGGGELEVAGAFATTGAAIAATATLGLLLVAGGLLLGRIRRARTPSRARPSRRMWARSTRGLSDPVR